jgi:hypothetical protein
MEWLDVTLVGIERAAVGLLEPGLTHKERQEMSTRWFAVSPTTPQAVIVDIANDTDDRWRRPWISACALLAAANMPELNLEELGGPNVTDDNHIVGETMAAIRRRRTAQPA